MNGIISVTCNIVPRSGKLTVSPGIGFGHWSMSWQAASILGSPLSKNSGAIRAHISVKKLTKGSRVMMTTLWNNKYCDFIKNEKCGNKLQIFQRDKTQYSIATHTILVMFLQFAWKVLLQILFSSNSTSV